MTDFVILTVGESRQHEQHLVSIISKFENKCFLFCKSAVQRGFKPCLKLLFKIKHGFCD